MASKKLYIALQSPSVEMKIKSEPDCSGKSATLTAIFLRHDVAEAEKVRRRMADIQNRVFTDAVEVAGEVNRLEDQYSYLVDEELAKLVETGKAKFLEGKTYMDSPEALRSARLTQENDLRNLLRSQIIALKDVPLEIWDEDGKMTKLTVPDTRTAVDNEELWGAGTNCLNALLDVLLLSNPWSSSLARAQQNVLYNLQLLADSVSKN
jgi:hypothetical protein